MNSHSLVGRIISDIELKFLPTGTQLASFRMSVQRGNGKKDANGYPESDVFGIKVFGKRAEALNEHARKGTVLAVTGRTELKQVQDGKGYWVEVIADSWGFVPKSTDQPAHPAPEEVGF